MLGALRLTVWRVMITHATTSFLRPSSPQQRANSTSTLLPSVRGRPGQVPRYGKFGVRTSLNRARQAVVLRGPAVQLNSGLTAPKTGRPLRPARLLGSIGRFHATVVPLTGIEN